MPSVEVRTFRRSDREQLAELVNAHAAAVVPGLGVSVSTVLSQLERQPDEFIIDPWVSARQTLIAEQNQRVAAAAHLVRYAADARVSPSYRNVGEIRWLLFWPEAAASGPPYWTGAAEAADALMTACLQQLEAWGVSRQRAEGDLPVRGVYGSSGPVAACPRPVRASRIQPRRPQRAGLPGQSRGSPPACCPDSRPRASSDRSESTARACRPSSMTNHRLHRGGGLRGR